MPNKLLVLGGSGLLGSRICNQAIRRGWQVISLSRTGRLPCISSSAVNLRSYPIDLQTVVNADNHQHQYPADLIDDISDCDAIVHSVGSLFESDAYKRYVKQLKCSSAPTAGAQTVPFELLQRDSLSWLLEFSNQYMPRLRVASYISVADRLLPFPVDEMLVDRRYYSTKREAERLLTEFKQQSVQSIIARPGFMFSDQSPITLPLSGVLSVMHSVKTFILPKAVQAVLPTPPEQPLHVDTVAGCLVDRIASVLMSDFGPTVVDHINPLVLTADQLINNSHDQI